MQAALGIMSFKNLCTRCPRSSYSTWYIVGFELDESFRTKVNFSAHRAFRAVEVLMGITGIIERSHSHIADFLLPRY